MIKPYKLVITLLLTIVVLAACNNAENSTSEDTSKTITTNTDAKEVDESVDSEEPTTDNAQQEEQSENDTTSITFSSKGKSKTEELRTISSNKYSIQAIPGFSLTPEEPGKDLLLYEQDDSVFMRIEAMSASATTFDELVANTEQTMKAISEGYEPYEITPFIGDQTLSKSSAYIANLDAEEVITVVFVKGEKLVRLTIYDNSEVDYSEIMIKMGLTIE